MTATHAGSDARDVGVTVIIATYNRAELLRQTLSAMTRVDRRGLAVEFVLIDNNSTEHNSNVIASFQDRLPLRHLFEEQPGKNRALNKALDDVQLRDIVVFTDDDVMPRTDWLTEIASGCARHPNCNVFGGKIIVNWPDCEIPSWARHPFILSFGYALHDLGESDIQYGMNECPFGPNFWVRRCVFDDRRRYSEEVGLMGSETTFLKQLADDGYTMTYLPSAVVQHCIQEGQVTEAVIRKRAYRLGRSAPHFGLCRPRLLKHSRLAWRALRVVALTRYAVLYVFARCVRRTDRRVLLAVQALQGMGYCVESLVLTQHVRRKPRNASHETARQ